MRTNHTLINKSSMKNLKNPWNISIPLYSGIRFFSLLECSSDLEKNRYFDNCSLKSSLRTPIWFFYGILCESPFGTFFIREQLTKPLLEKISICVICAISTHIHNVNIRWFLGTVLRSVMFFWVDVSTVRNRICRVTAATTS